MSEYISLFSLLATSSVEVFIQSLGLYLVITAVIILYALPLILLFRIFKQHYSIYFIPILGFINFIFILSFIHYSHFLARINGSISSILLLLSIPILQIILISIWAKWRKYSLNLLIKKPVIQKKVVGIILLLTVFHIALFSLLSLNSYDRDSNRFYVPGYQINHDSMWLLNLTKYLKFENIPSTNSMFYKVNNYDDGYPSGGPMFVVAISEMMNVDQYSIYSRVIIYLFLLNIFVLFGGVDVLLSKRSSLTTLILILSIFVGLFSYLSLSITNTSVLAAVVSTPVLIYLLFLLLHKMDNKLSRHIFVLMTFLSIFALFYLYGIYQFFYLIAILGLLMVYNQRRKYLFLLATVVISCILILIIPANFTLFKNATTGAFTSQATEVNIFKGMRGNTIGFINPLAGQSLWYFSSDYRFSQGTLDNYWLYFFLMLLIIGIIAFPTVDEKRYSNQRMVGVILLLVITSLVVFTYFITKSPYQNVKALFNFTILWPIVLFLFFYPKLVSSNLLIKIFTASAFILIAAFSIKSSLVSYRYIGVPFVEHNYELMSIAPEICKDESSIVFLGRDEWSKYFLLNCANISYFYDREENLERATNFWELNQIPSLNVQCVNKLQLTDDFQPTFKRALVDKCFDFDLEEYELVKEYQYHDLYELKQ